jgi:hypothetical protein
MSSSGPPSKSRPSDPEFWTVDNQLPDPIPVSKAELDAIEQHFGDLLDAIFESQSRTVPAVTTASQKGDRR